MNYDLNKVKEIISEVHPKFGCISFYLDRPGEVVEMLGLDMSIGAPERFGIQILNDDGKYSIEDIDDLINTMKYMGFRIYYWDYDNRDILFFEFNLTNGDNVHWRSGDCIEMGPSYERVVNNL